MILNIVFINIYQLCNLFYLLLLKNVLSVLPFICKKVCRLVRLVRLCMLLHIKLLRYYHLLSWDFYRVLSSLLSLYLVYVAIVSHFLKLVNSYLLICFYLVVLFFASCKH